MLQAGKWKSFSFTDTDSIWMYKAAENIGSRSFTYWKQALTSVVYKQLQHHQKVHF